MTPLTLENNSKFQKARAGKIPTRALKGYRVALISSRPEVSSISWDSSAGFPGHRRK
jgi:hypothetical protein